MAGGGGAMTSNKISTQIEQYLEYKHSLGFKLEGESSVLRSFSRHTIGQGYEGNLTMDIVFSWLASSGNQTDKSLGRRLDVIKPYSKYAAAFDPEAVCITGRIYSNVHARPEPYIYSEAETLALMRACDRLFSPDGIRARTVKTVIGLLWATGLRPSEPFNLHIRDVDLERNITFIRETKFSKERIIPLSESAAGQMKAYREWVVGTLGHKRPEDPFFYTTGGKPMVEKAMRYAFKLIRDSIHASPKGYPHVRLYDFRHTRACNTIIQWLRTGEDISSCLHTLSAYLGHVHPEDTYWYLSATPELMRLACSRYED